jgi:ABC transporter substrate binding protein (PQQ-dependent alcohol dehydrogenase system)
MTSRLFFVLFAIIFASNAYADDVRILYVDRDGDPYYARRFSYGRIYDATRQSAISGAELGVKDARIIGRAIGSTFTLSRLTLSPNALAAKEIAVRLKSESNVAVILDLPTKDIQEIANNTIGIPLFNIRDPGDDLRKQTCKSNLFHVIPSEAMASDALAQYLKLLNWTNILMLSGEDPIDDIKSKSFETSANKFGLNVVEHRRFVAGNDPRQRDQNNVRLLTGGVDYDAVFVADESGDFATILPYRTALPRPVIGSAGLRATAWHPNWERNGAPQLNLRFFKLAQHPMSENDWAAWVAVKSVVEAIVHADKYDGSTLKVLSAPETIIELYKGYPGSYRIWDHQLRQTMLLGTTDAVVALAPVEGALHEFNNLDTLGLDAPEFRCEQ